MVLTMAAVAAAKEMPSHGFSVSVNVAPNEGNGKAGKGGGFTSEVHLSEHYSPREQRILYNSARSCEVHHLLQGPLEFNDTLQLDGDES